MSGSTRVTGQLLAALLAFAGLWSLGLVIGTGLVPVIGGTETTGVVETSTSTTLVDEVGGGLAYAYTGLPLVPTMLMALLATRRPRTWRVVAAFVVVGILGLFNLAAMLTIGIFFVPATAALAAAALVLVARAAAPPAPA